MHVNVGELIEKIIKARAKYLVLILGLCFFNKVPAIPWLDRISLSIMVIDIT